MKISHLLALASLAVLAFLPGCMLFSYGDLEPGARSQAAIATVHAEELDALAGELQPGAEVTQDQAARIRAAADEAIDLRDHTLEFHRLITGEEPADAGGEQ